MKNFLTSLLIVTGSLVCSVQAKEHDNTSWNALSDPGLLMEYCESQFIKDSSQPTCDISPNSSTRARMFSEGLWETWSGRTHLAEMKFKYLYESEKWSLWGSIGLLELAYTTENKNELASLLKKYKESFLSSDKPLFLKTYEHYELWHASENFEWEKLESLLQRYSKEQIQNDPALFFFQSSILVNNKQILELDELLSEVPLNVKETIHYINAMVAYTSLKYGEKERDIIISKFAKERPKEIAIVLSDAFNELSNDDPDVSKAALSKIYKITKSSKENVNLVLKTILILCAYNKFYESTEVFKIANFRNDVILDDFTAYHSFLAWVYLSQNLDNEVLNRVEKAIDMAPKDLTANRIKLYLARKNEEPDLALSSLKVLLNTSPHSESLREEISYFRNKYKTSEFESIYQQMITNH